MIFRKYICSLRSTLENFQRSLPNKHKSAILTTRTQVAVHELGIASRTSFASEGNPESTPTMTPTQIYKHGFSDRDVEKGEKSLRRAISARHLVFIAIGGAAGTGLFLGSGTALAHGGPLGSLLAYCVVATILHAVMTGLGEMAAFMPVAGSFTVFATRFVDRSLGFAMGWTFWFSCTSLLF